MQKRHMSVPFCWLAVTKCTLITDLRAQTTDLHFNGFKEINAL